jgi:hypothetical protein
MKTRNFALCALGLAAAITFGGAATASAQATSTTRIPVRKDDPVVQKTDTIRLPGRVDTVMVRVRPDTVVRTVTGPTRYDTTMVMPPLMRLPKGYFGLGGGVAVPMNNWRNATKDGWNLQAQAGWFPANGTIGIRADVNWARFSNRETDCRLCPDPKLLAGSADLVARFPLDQRSKLNPVIYILGGGGIDKFSDFLPYRNGDGKIVTAGTETFLAYPNATTPLATAANRGTKDLFFHYEAGAGADITFGGLHTFVETKYTTINTINGNSHYWPIVVGLKFY